MTWAPQEMQKSLYSVLNADSALRALGFPSTGAFVYDCYGVPQDTAYPYITIYALPSEDRGNYKWEGWETEFQIDIWLRGNGHGSKPVQLIQKRIDELLHKARICVDGFNVVSLRRTTVNIMVEDDNITLHGIQRFKLLLGEV